MEFTDDNFCDCTKKRENKCPSCGKDLAYIDSPFGAIPSLKLIEKYFDIIEDKFNNEKEKLTGFVESGISKLFLEKKSEIDEFQIRMSKEFHDMKERTDKLKLDFENTIDKKSESVSFFINRIFENFSKYLSVFQNTINLMANLTQDFEKAKSKYIDLLVPQINELIESLKIFQKIFPKAEIYTTGIHKSETKKVFELNKNFVSNHSLQNKKRQFREVWDNISLFTNSYIDKYSNNELPGTEKKGMI
ncbi:MAG: hypothetical protein EU549_00775 [Promethearchaeota archaeon]|nr:MAG: hypothetical protein EU549_00775 [Candidatus Lokiarchaeota archaeon]